MAAHCRQSEGCATLIACSELHLHRCHAVRMLLRNITNTAVAYILQSFSVFQRTKKNPF